MKFMGGIKIRQFLSTYEEWHALLIGIGEGYCPWAPKFPMSAILRAQVIKEFHYYMSGKAVGFAALIFTIALATRWALGVLL